MSLLSLVLHDCSQNAKNRYFLQLVAIREKVLGKMGPIFAFPWKTGINVKHAIFHIWPCLYALYVATSTSFPGSLAMFVCSLCSD